MIISFLLTIYLLYLIHERTSQILALIESVTIWVCYLYIIAEVLSLFDSVDRIHVCFCLILYSLAAVLLILLQFKKRKGIIDSHKRLPIGLNDRFCIILFIILFCIEIILLFLSLNTVPYNWDSMTYHLARIAHWKENASIAHYVTPEIRQLTSPPLAEIVNLYVFIIYDCRDVIMNLLQFISYAFSAILVYGIAKKIGISQKNCLIGVLLFMSMPIAFAEALSTQVDEFATFWLLAFVFIIVDFLDNELKYSKYLILKSLFLGIIVGLGYLTKPSILIAEVVFALWVLGYRFYKKRNIAQIVVVALLSSVTAFLIALPEIIRNITTFGSISDPQAGARQLVGTLNPLYLFINACKNISDNLTNIYFSNSGYVVSKIIFKLASILRVSINDPSISEDGKEYIINSAGNYSQDSANNFVIVIIFLLLLCYLIFRRDKKTFIRSKINQFFCVSGVSFVLFVLVVRWEPYVSRYMLGYLAILCPAIAGQLDGIEKKSFKSYYAILSLIIFICVVDLYGLFCFHGKIILEQKQNEKYSDGYFVYKMSSIGAYDSVTEYVKDHSYSLIGIEVASNSYEYPLWQALSGDGVQIESLTETPNASSIYDDESFKPDCIITVDFGEKKSISYHGNIYSFAQSFEDEACIYIKD